MRKPGALYATRMRDQGSSLLNSVAEAVEIGECAGVPIQFSHHQVSAERALGLIKKSRALIEADQAKGDPPPTPANTPSRQTIRLTIILSMARCDHNSRSHT